LPDGLSGAREPYGGPVISGVEMIESDKYSQYITELNRLESLLTHRGGSVRNPD
jgi:hypothetical protein